MALGEAAGFGTAAGCAGMAVFFSGDSLAPPGASPVPPGPYLAAKAVSGSITMSAYAGDPELAPANFRTFLEQGLNVATRIKLW
jgi:hypothetical protein